MSASNKKMPAYLKLIAGGGASLVAKTAVAPFERCKLLLQTSRGISKSAGSVLNTVIREQGFLALWRGNGANCMRIFPTSALRFFFFDVYQNIASFGSPEGEPLSMPRQLASGAMSGMTTLTLTYPLDLVRTRIATDMSSQEIARSGYAHSIRSAIKECGLRGLYHGYSISVIEIAPYLSISMGGYHWLKERFETSEQFHFQRLFYGWLAGSIASLTCYPMDTVKRHMMIMSANNSKINLTIGNCVKQIWSKGGIAEFYRGCLVNVANSGPSAAILFFAHDFLCESLHSFHT